MINPFFHATAREIAESQKRGINITRKQKKETLARLEKEFEDDQNENRVLTLGNDDENSLTKVKVDAKTHQDRVEPVEQNCSHDSC